MSNEMAEKAMKLVATIDRDTSSRDKDESTSDEDVEEIKLKEEGLNLAAEEMMDAFKNNDVNELVLSLKNFLSMARS